MKSSRLESSIKIRKVLKRCIPFCVFLATLLISGYFSTIGADSEHDGVLAKPAMDVASGRMLFRETFTQYGALTTLIQAASLNVFGKYLITLKLVTAFFYGLISILLFLILKKILPESIAFICLVVWILLAPYYEVTFLIWSSVYALFFQLLGTWLLLIAFEKKASKFVFLGGVSTALVLWCRLPVGVFMFLAIVGFYIYAYFSKEIDAEELKRGLFNFILGSLGVHVLFLTWLGVNHALSDWWKQAILHPFLWSQLWHDNFTNDYLHRLFPGPYFISTISLLPIATICVFIRNSKNKIICLLAFVGLASWLQFYPVPCIRHQYWGGTPMLGLLALLVYQVANERLAGSSNESKNGIKWLAIIIFITIFAQDIDHRINAGIAKINKKYYFIDQPVFLKNIRLSKDEAEFYVSTYQKIEKYFTDHPEGNVMASGDAVLCLTFDARIKNFHPMSVNWITNVLVYPDYLKQLNQYVKQNKPLEIHGTP